MLRTALSPIVRQGHHKIFWGAATATGAVCIATTAYRYNESAYCSPSVIGDGKVVNASNGNIMKQDLTVSSQPTTEESFLSSLSLQNFYNDIEQCRSLVLPTMEALLRASRLVTTAALMAADYQMYYIQRKYSDSFVSEVYSWVFPDNNNQSLCKEKTRKQRVLEDKIEELEKNLDKAQYEYTKSPADKKKKYVGSIDIEQHTISKRKQKEEMMNIANQLADAQDELTSLVKEESTQNNEGRKSIHQRNAERLLNMCRNNAGVYIKVGQHLANLDLLLPEEYIQTLASLFDDAPVSSYEDVCSVVKEELGASPEELFSDFSETPLASASLAQVHTATCKKTGKKLAIKVQHKGLRETSGGDLFACSTVVGIAEKLFDDFNFGWICEELTPQLPKELDFNNEGQNAEAASAHIKSTGLDCVIPHVLWDFTTERVLSMEFEEGFRATDVDSIDKAGICRREVAKLISSVFNAQIFGPGFVHCDPHEANVLLREHPSKKGKPQIVLVDHGLYKKLDGDFTEAYARLWKGIVMANIPDIQSACKKLGVHKMYPLLAAMLTSRPFDEVVERSQSRSLDASTVSSGGGDEAVIRGYAQRYIREIVQMLDIVPRQMLLIFKMNDCLRHVDMALGSPVNNLVVAGKYASKRVYESDKEKRQQSKGGVLSLLRDWLSYMNVLMRINMYELSTRLYITK